MLFRSRAAVKTGEGARPSLVFAHGVRAGDETDRGFEPDAPATIDSSPPEIVGVDRVDANRQLCDLAALFARQALSSLGQDGGPH